MLHDPIFILLLTAIIVVTIIYFGRSWSPPVATNASRVKAVSGNPAREGYRIDLKPPHDREAIRDRATRWFILLVITAVLVIFPTLFGMLWGSFIGGFAIKVVGLLGFLISLYLFYLLSRRLLVYNQEWSAYVTQDPFTGENIPYGPGLHPSFPWEQRNAGGNESLEVITKAFTVMVQTKTAQLEVESSFQYAVDLTGITKFIGNDASTIEGGFVAFIQSFLTERYAEMTAEEARKDIANTNIALSNAFMGTDISNTVPINFEAKFGIVTVSLVIKSLKLPAAVQKTRDALDEAAMLHGIVAKMIGTTPEGLTAKLESGEIDKERHDKLLNRAMATSENATMDINVIEGNLGNAVAMGLSRFLGGGNKPRGRKH